VRSGKADQLILQIWSIDASCGDLDCEFPILWAAVPETGWSRSSVIEERARRTRRDAVQAPGPVWEHIKIRRQRRPRTLSDDDYLPQIYS
jgi:predicted transposase YbfD/YdcC